MEKFSVIWHDVEGGAWYPVGLIWRFPKGMFFAYVEGSRKNRNIYNFLGMKQPDGLFFSDNSFPFIDNRMMKPSRDDYSEYMRWAGLASTSIDPFHLLSRMGTGKSSDPLQIYPVPIRGYNNKYKTFFFCHGIRHMPQSAKDVVSKLRPGDLLYPVLDVCNTYDKYAVGIRTERPLHFIGYFPRYVSQDVTDVVQSDASSFQIVVERVNLDAPASYRLLCSAQGQWPNGFMPCSRADYMLINKKVNDAILSKYYLSILNNMA